MRKYKNPLMEWTPGAVIARFCCGFGLGCILDLLLIAFGLRVLRHVEAYPLTWVLILLGATPVAVGVAAIFRLEQVGDLFRGEKHSGEITRRRKRR